MNQALETRLARAAFEHASLGALLAALEGADWALVFPGEDALLSALAALLPGQTLRLDSRLSVSESALRGAALETGAFDADWRSSGVWLLEPDERAIKRARKAEAHLIVDATFCPGGGFLARGAAFVTYRHAAALSGHGDVPFAALLGIGEPPAPTPQDGLSALSDALLRRDLPSLGARLGRQTRAAHTLAERLGARAALLSGAVLHVNGELPPTALFAAGVPLGGVRSARRDISGGVLLSVGLEGVEDLWRDLTGAVGAPEDAAVADEVTPEEALPDAQIPDALVVELVGAPTGAQFAVPAPEHPESDAPLPPDLPAALPGAGENADPTADLSEAQLAAFERLREWRNAEARRQEVSRFIIASNATLAQIAREAPQSEAELRAVKGMGPERVRKYAGAILNMLRGMR